MTDYIPGETRRAIHHDESLRWASGASRVLCSIVSCSAILTGLDRIQLDPRVGILRVNLGCRAPSAFFRADGGGCRIQFQELLLRLYGARINGAPALNSPARAFVYPCSYRSDYRFIASLRSRFLSSARSDRPSFVRITRLRSVAGYRSVGMLSILSFVGGPEGGHCFNSCAFVMALLDCPTSRAALPPPPVRYTLYVNPGQNIPLDHFQSSLVGNYGEEVLPVLLTCEAKKGCDGISP